MYCAESVLLAIAEAKNIKSDLIPKIATGFCSGMSRTFNLCGALSGGILAISLFTGRNSPEESVELNYALVQELVSRFREKFGSSNCYELIECDLNTTAGQKKFVDDNLVVKCTQLTEEAARIAFELIEKQIETDR